MRLVVHLERLPDNVLVAAEAPLPVAMAQDQHGFGAQIVVLRIEHPAERWLHAENVEEIRRNDPCRHALRLAAA